MVKIHQKVRTERNFLNLIRNVCKTSSAYIVFIDERLIAFPVDQEHGKVASVVSDSVRPHRQEKGKDVYTVITVTQNCIGGSSHDNNARKRYKSKKITREEMKLYL